MIYSEKEFNGLRYCLYLPDGFDENMRYPVVFFTHGAGSRGDDLTLIKHHPVVENILPQIGEGILIAPQCPSNTWFDVFENLLALVEYAYNRPYTNQERFYGAGASMGGYAAYQLMMSRPNLFAAGIVCCGGGMYWNAERLKEIPLRIFHGAQDTVVLPCESEHMSERVNACGGNAKLVIFPDCGHDCWTKTFQDDENIKWLLKQEKKYARI